MPLGFTYGGVRAHIYAHSVLYFLVGQMGEGAAANHWKVSKCLNEK